MTDLDSQKAAIAAAVMANDINYIKENVIAIKLELHQLKVDSDSAYVTKIEFQPIQRLVYGLVSLALSGIVIAVLALVVK